MTEPRSMMRLEAARNPAEMAHRCWEAERRVEKLEQALRETRDGLAALALWRDHSEAGCNACGARAYNYDPVEHDTRCAFLTSRGGRP